jgi:peptidoglycan/xylan/chitin deacetylase (PgdA/CDA1 family)
MTLLHEYKYKVIPLSKAVHLLRIGANTQKNIVITFDDGYMDFKEAAWPILQKWNYPATVFISTGLVGCTSEVFLHKPCMGWEDILRVQLEGVEIGSHTITHNKMQYLSTQELLEELEGSKRVIEDKLSVAVKSFSCPYAFPDTDDFKKIYKASLAKAGYEYGVTTRIGRASSKDDLHMLKRIPINDYDDTELFLTKLEGGYDWISLPQRLKKIIKKL